MRVDFSETEDIGAMNRVIRLDRDLLSLFVLNAPDERIEDER